MIHVTRLNHDSVVLNSDLIEQIETTPDTVVSLTTGQRLMVLESPEDIIHRVIDYRREVMGYLFTQPPVVRKREDDEDGQS